MSVNRQNKYDDKSEQCNLLAWELYLSFIEDFDQPKPS